MKTYGHNVKLNVTKVTQLMEQKQLVKNSEVTRNNYKGPIEDVRSSIFIISCEVILGYLT